MVHVPYKVPQHLGVLQEGGGVLLDRYVDSTGPGVLMKAFLLAFSLPVTKAPWSRTRHLLSQRRVQANAPHAPYSPYECSELVGYGDMLPVGSMNWARDILQGRSNANPQLSGPPCSYRTS
jgi:hypothetical protein